MFFFLFALVILISLYDLKYRKIPNWVTLPLMLLGLYVSLPSTPIIWMVIWMFVALMLTGVAQIVVRALSQKRVTIGFKTPGAWRTVVFMGLLAYLR